MNGHEFLQMIRTADYETIRPHLCIRLHDAKDVQGNLNDKVHTEWGAFCASYHIQGYIGGGVNMLAAVELWMLKQWGIHRDMLHKDALAAMKAVDPPAITDMAELIGQLTGRKAAIESQVHMLILGAQSGAYGAAYLSDPALLDTIGQRIGGNYYILPSSVHEVIAMPGREHMAGDLSKIVYSINRQADVIPLSDRLSDTIHYYDIEAKTLKPCEAYRPELKEAIHEAKKAVHRKTL